MSKVSLDFMRSSLKIDLESQKVKPDPVGGPYLYTSS